MGCPLFVIIGTPIKWTVTTHDKSTGVLSDADSVPTYRLYEDETAIALMTGSMSKLDDANTTGLYSELVVCAASEGFEHGKVYTVLVEATVDGFKGGIAYTFTAYASFPRQYQVLEDGLEYKLAATTAITDLVGDRMYPLYVPQNSVMPAISFGRMLGRRDHNTIRDSGLAEFSIQIDVWADTYAGALAIAEQVRLALEDSTGLWDTVQIQAVLFEGDEYFFDSEQKRHNVSMEFEVWHLEERAL